MPPIPNTLNINPPTFQTCWNSAWILDRKQHSDVNEAHVDPVIILEPKITKIYVFEHQIKYSKSS